MKKVLKGFLKIVFSRTLIVLLMLLGQILVFLSAYFYVYKFFPAIVEVLSLLDAVFLIIIINRKEPAEFKLTWAILVCLLPVWGGLMFALVETNWSVVGLRKKIKKEKECSENLLTTSAGTKKALERESMSFQHFAYYMEKTSHFPVFHNTKTTYYSNGADKFEDLRAELRKAEKYIFLEYFIIDNGQVWDSVLEILKEKAAQGVDVRVMYDGLCSLLLLPYGYPKKLASFGIKAKMFAPVVPFLSTTQNNRDHRKIVVIDGKVAYTGGVNLADEYANIKERFGYWKDNGIKIEGRAVKSFLLMFIQNWNLYGKEDIDYSQYLAEEEERESFEHDGFVIPYGDTPIVHNEVGKHVYVDILSHATDYIHIMTPYFIVDREFLSLLTYAGQRGIEVKMILPHIPDKKYAFWIARTYYTELLNAGIKIYEFTPGFVHAKMVTADDRIGTVGTVNMDYRSFYHHFECGVVMYENSAIKDMEKDFQDTLEQCQEVTYEYYKSISWFQRTMGKVLKLFGPLL